MTPAARKPLMLCVDDDLLVLKALTRLFQDEPLRVITTLQPQLALDWVRRLDVGVLLTDQRMPDMAGTDLIDRVQRCSPQTSCVILTGYTSDVSLQRSRLQGVHGLVSKPWDGFMLKAAVRQILRERRIEEQEDRTSSGG